MPITLTMSDDGKYVIEKVIGDINRTLAMGYNREAHAFGVKHGINRFLMDMTKSRNKETITGNYEFAYRDMKSTDIDPSARVAFLVSPDDHSHDFIEVVFLNAGYNVRIFRDRKEAVRFLLEE